MSLLEPHNLPFAVAFGMMAAALVLQLAGLGIDAGGDLDLADVDGESGGLPEASAGLAILTLLGLGKVPLMVWLMVFLFVFGLVGLGLQAFADELTGAPLYPSLAAIIAGIAALPLTSGLVRPLGRIMPQDETSAVGLDSLVGRRGQIAIGTAARGSPARTTVRDRHGHAHHIMLEPHEDGSEIEAGDEVLVVRREGQVFYGVPLAERQLAPST